MILKIQLVVSILGLSLLPIQSKALSDGESRSLEKLVQAYVNDKIRNEDQAALLFYTGFNSLQIYIARSQANQIETQDKVAPEIRKKVIEDLRRRAGNQAYENAKVVAEVADKLVVENLAKGGANLQDEIEKRIEILKENYQPFLVDSKKEVKQSFVEFLMAASQKSDFSSDLLKAFDYKSQSPEHRVAAEHIFRYTASMISMLERGGIGSRELFALGLSSSMHSVSYYDLRKQISEDKNNEGELRRVVRSNFDMSERIRLQQGNDLDLIENLAKQMIGQHYRPFELRHTMSDSNWVNDFLAKSPSRQATFDAAFLYFYKNWLKDQFENEERAANYNKWFIEEYKIQVPLRFRARVAEAKERLAKSSFLVNSTFKVSINDQVQRIDKNYPIPLAIGDRLKIEFRDVQNLGQQIFSGSLVVEDKVHFLKLVTDSETKTIVFQNKVPSMSQTFIVSNPEHIEKDYKIDVKLGNLNANFLLRISWKETLLNLKDPTLEEEALERVIIYIRQQLAVEWKDKTWFGSYYKVSHEKGIKTGIGSLEEFISGLTVAERANLVRAGLIDKLRQAYPSARPSGWFSTEKDDYDYVVEKLNLFKSALEN